ncbi:MAG: molybdopterin molybdenumtransferase MoeA, partial [Thermomicrobiales bacterium]|nr:molybdopterin molybdenumtransferase MoeA [Thermomicrobiales bacterium]
MMGDDLDRMRHPDEARRTILERATLLPAEEAPLAEAAGRVLAQDLVAEEDAPPFAAATMDGYAVVAGDPSPWREIVGRQTAGFMLGLEVSDGHAVAITTGSPMPPGADAVIPVEETEESDGHVVVHQDDVAPGTNVRPRGSDLKKGALVLAAGTTLGPAEVGLAAGLGYARVPVRRQAR